MFCPFCKAEYRAGIQLCSDCSFPLVDSIPKDDSDPDFMVLLWNGESLPFLEAVCAEFDRAGISVAAPRVEVLLRDPADRYHLKNLKTFPYVLGAFKRDFPAARKILEAAAAEFVPPIAIPPADAYQEPFDESPGVVRKGKYLGSLDTTCPIYSSKDLRAVEFVEASLDGLDIPYRRVCLENGACEIQVHPQFETAGRGLVEEIRRGISSQAKELQTEDANLGDSGPESYFLAWFLPLVYYLLMILSGLEESRSFGVSYGLLTFGLGASWIGTVWMVYQAFRYEVRPFRYCVAAFLPFTFVWYYVERYRVRQGAQRLPVAVRARLHPPQT